MSDITTHLLLPHILASQAQKHVTHNEALRLLDAMVQLSVLDRARTARSLGDLTIRWTRRSRSLAADIWGAGDVPLAEDSEAYEVEIRDGSTIKRTLTATTTSVLYTAAQQTADWGAPLGPGQALAVGIYQLSALIGRGAGRSVTLTF